jgi:hypothetical protein
MVRDTITGFESIIGSTLADYIAVGTEDGTVTGGAAADQIVLGSGKTNVDLNKIAVAGNVAGADVVTGFTAGADNILTQDAGTPAYALFNGTSNGAVVLATGTTLNACHAANNNFTVGTISTNVATHTFATYLAGTSTIAQLEGAIATAVGAAADGDFANTDKLIVAVDDGTHTGIIYVESAANGNAIADAELSVQAILKGVSDATALTAGDFLFA